ncbi:MAG: GNAT family N-acetyltransferase [Eubacteriales bacterium]
MRKANMEDLPEVQSLYRDVVKEMHRNGITIWNHQYPNDYLAQDIEKGGLYLCYNEKQELYGAFSLSIGYTAAAPVSWENPDAVAVYLSRFVVNPVYKRQGCAKLLLEHAKEEALALGGEYLRLYAVNSNTPALNMYHKYGFIQVEGTSDTDIVKGSTLTEYGLEVKLG